MTQWTLDNKIVDAYWQGFNEGGPMLFAPVGCNRNELLMGMTDSRIGWYPHREVGDVLVLANDRRPGAVLVVWRIPT